MLETYVALPEAVIVHHTFEEVDWRPTMDTSDDRRNWMVTASEGIETLDE